MKCVIATTGGGGHLFPAIRVAEELKRKSHDVLFVGSFSLGLDILKQRQFPYRHLEASGLGKNPVKAIKSLYQYFSGIFSARNILRNFRADVVIGFGGFGSVSTILAASLSKIPILVHEQNVVPGKANRFLARFARKIAVSFSESEAYFRKGAVTVSGYPCFLEKKSYDRTGLLAKYGLAEGRKVLLIFGGSQGSQRINQAFADSIAAVNEKIPFQFIHLCGERDYTELKTRYASLRLPHVVLPFSKEIGEFYFLADGVVARAGAGTVTEVAMYQKPFIAIPYPHAGGHQRNNALALMKSGRGMMIEEKDLTGRVLADGIVRILNEKRGQVPADQIYRPDAALKIVSLAEEITR